MPSPRPANACKRSHFAWNISIKYTNKPVIDILFLVLSSLSSPSQRNCDERKWQKIRSTNAQSIRFNIGNFCCDECDRFCFVQSSNSRHLHCSVLPPMCRIFVRLRSHFLQNVSNQHLCFFSPLLSSEKNSKPLAKCNPENG